MASKSGHLDADKGAEVEELLDTVESLLDRVKVLYEQYFLGIQKQAPAHLHHDIDRKLRDLSQIQVRNTAMRYRLATVQQKYGSYNTYWRRTLRQIENGTYVRSLSRIGRQAARSGAAIPEEILAAMPKRMREQVARDREAALAQQQRRRGAAAGGEAELAAGTGDDFELDIEEAALDDVATIHSKPPPGVVHQLEEDDVDVDALFAAITDAGDAGDERDGAPKPAKKRASTDVGMGQGGQQTMGRPSAQPEPVAAVEPQRPQSGQRAPVAAAAPAGGQRPQSGQGAPGSSPGPATQPLPAPRPLPVAAAPAAAAPAPAPSAPVSPPAGQAVLGRIAVGPPVARPAGGQNPSAPQTQQMGAVRPARVSPPGVGNGAAPGPSTRPMGAAVAAAPGPSTAQMPAAPPPPPHRPPPPGALKTPPATVEPAAARMTPKGVPAARPTPPSSPPITPPSMSPSVPAGGTGSMPRVRPPSGVPPIGSFAPRSADPRDPAAPPAAKPAIPPPPSSAGGPPRPPPIPSIPRPPIPSAKPAAAPPPVAPQAAPSRPSSPAVGAAGAGAAVARPLPAGVSQADVSALYKEYVRAKSSVGEQSDAKTYDRLLRTIEQQAPKIMEEHHAKGVEFQVVVKDNQVVLRAKPKP